VTDRELIEQAKKAMEYMKKEENHDN